MALVADSSLITDEVKESFFSALAVQAKYLAENPKKGFSIKSNWGVMEYTGLYVLSLVLDNKNFRETAVYFLKMALHTQIHEDGMQWEASPMYHNEVLAAYLEVLRVANLYEDEPFSEEEKKIIKNMVYATLVHTYPNHHQLMTGDSDDTDVRDIISEAAVLFNEPEFKFAGFKHLDFEGAWLYGTKGIEAYENLEISAIPGGLTICAESGEAIWRKSYNDDSDFLYFRNGSLGGGHGHQDKLHVEVWFDGEEILRDSGRYTYKDIDERYVLKSAKAHNVPVINDSEYAPSRDSWTYENLPPSMGNIFSKKEGFLLFEGFHCGYIKEGVLLRRRVAAPKSDIIIISDEIIGNKGNTLSQNFAFAEHISLSKENDLIIGKGIKSEFIIKSFDERGEVAAEIGKAPISRHYNEMRKSSALKMETKNSYFLTTIIAKNVSEEKADIAKENVHNYAYEITLKEDEAQGYIVTRNSEQYGVVLLKDDVGNHKDLNGIRGIYGLGQTMAAALHENPKYMTVLRC